MRWPWWFWLLMGLVFAAGFAWEYITKNTPGPILTFVVGWLSGGLMTQAWYERRRGVRNAGDVPA